MNAAMPLLSGWETFVMILALAAGIMATRFIPFLLFAGRRTLPGWVTYLGSVLPHSAMALLLVYCLKDVSFVKSPHAAPEAIAIAFTAALHLWRGNTLLSIAGGTIGYMFLVQRVFV